MSDFFTLGWPSSMKRQSLSYSSWMRSKTLKNAGLFG